MKKRLLMIRNRRRDGEEPPIQVMEAIEDIVEIPGEVRQDLKKRLTAIVPLRTCLRASSLGRGGDTLGLGPSLNFKHVALPRGFEPLLPA